MKYILAGIYIESFEWPSHIQILVGESNTTDVSFDLFDGICIAICIVIWG